MNTKLVNGGLVVLAVVCAFLVGGLLDIQETNYIKVSEDGSVNLGASPGPDHYGQQYFFAGLTTDKINEGNSATLTVAATATPTAAQFCDNAVLSYAPTTTASTATLPTAATLIADCLPNIGDSKTLLFKQTGYATTTTLFAGNTGSTLDYITSSTIVGGQSALIRATTDAATTVRYNLIPFDL